MRCRDCGRLNPNINKYCAQCGAVLASEVYEESEAIRYDPVAAREILKQAAALVESGNYQAAIEQCHRAIAADPLFPSAHNYLGTLYERVGEHDRAVQEYESAMELLSLRAPEATPKANGGHRASRVAVTAGFIAASTALVMLFVHLIATSSGPTRGSAIQAQTEPLTAPGLSPFSALKPEAGRPAGNDVPRRAPAPAGTVAPAPGAPANDATASTPGPASPSAPPRGAGSLANADSARELMAAGRWDDALRTLEILVEDASHVGTIDPALLFDRAQCHEALNRLDDARANYEAARRGYDEWLAAGDNPDAARRGLAACDRALQRLGAPR